ncbi:trigger factor [Inquilinus sp. CAU 1745]|uniref:trigger factor n=1 Tax=Inquilinus sp. CAU 1745 TaxID=3140369 RepID=UPI00325A55F7
MQVTETSTEGLRREFKVVVPAADIDQRVTDRLTQLGGQVRLPGFRPGKVPMGILRQRYGKSVMGEVLEGTVNETSQTTMTDRGLRPALQPKIEITSFDEGKDLEFTMAVEILPEVEPSDYSMLKLERLKAEVDDSAVDEGLKKLAEQQKRFTPVKKARAAKNGDQVLIDFEGSVDGVKKPEMAGSDFELELGSNRLIPGFEEGLVGVKPGESKTLNLTFPEAYPAKDVAGKDAVFEIQVKEVREAAESALDDELGKVMGFENLDGLKDALRRQAEGQFEQHSRQRLKRQLLDQLAETESFDVPAGMVDMEFDAIWKQIEAARQHHLETKDDPDHHHEHDPDLDKPEEELRADYRKIAERRVRLGLLLSEVGRRNDVQITQEELNRAMIAEARRYPGQERQVLEFFQKNPQAVDSLRAPILEDKVVDFIVDQAKVSERTVSPEELMRDPDEEEASEEKPKAKKAAAKKPAAKKEAAASEKKDAEKDAGEKPAKKTAAKAKKPAAKKAD